MKQLFNRKYYIVIILVFSTTLASIVLAGNKQNFFQLLQKEDDNKQSVMELQQERLRPKIKTDMKQYQGEERYAIEYQKAQERVRALSDAKDLSGLVQLSDEAESQWAKKNSKLYAGLMIDICGAIGSYDFDNKEHYVLARQCVKKALEKADQMPIDSEIKLVSFLSGDIEYVIKLVPSGNWFQDRTERTKYWCHAWQRLEKEIDVRFNFEANRPIYSPNMTVEERMKAEKYNQQRFLQRNKSSFTIETQRYLVDAYAKSPYNSQELDMYLDKCFLDKKFKASIKAQVQNRISQIQKEENSK